VVASCLPLSYTVVVNFAPVVRANNSYKMIDYSLMAARVYLVVVNDYVVIDKMLQMLDLHMDLVLVAFVVCKHFLFFKSKNKKIKFKFSS
jgi:hypothetical protein